MAGRYSGWVAKKGISAAAVDLGRKLLGRLDVRRRTPGVKTLIERATLDDGTIVEASFVGALPLIRVYPPKPGDESGCTLYVESGLLDLGPNIAADAGERFNRGSPQFDASPATLYFGTGVDCPDDEPGLNGRVNVEASGVSGQCLPEKGASVASRLSDPVKKQAQALLPASCWSGLMQRYIQAVYGGNALHYSASAEALTIEGLSIPAARSVGLVAHNGMLRFVVFEPETGAFSVYKCAPKTACFDACLKLWAKMPSEDAEERARKAKVLTIALSGCRFGRLLGTLTTGISGHTHFSKRPAMHFGDDGRTAAVVLESGGTATAYSLVFSIDDEGALAAEVDDLASGEVVNAGDDVWPLYVAGVPSQYGSQSIEKSGFSGADSIALGDSYDFPVYAVCVSGGFKVVRYTLLVSTRSPAASDGCAEDFDRPTNLGTSPPCSSAIESFTNVVSGYYCTGPGGVLWSTIETTALVEVDGELSLRATSNVSKALAVVPLGAETEVTTPITEGLYPQAYYEMGAGELGEESDGDCLFVSGEQPHPVLHHTSTWTAPTGDCTVNTNVVFGDCVGSSSGTGFPTYLSVETCDEKYIASIDGLTTYDCSNIVRQREATVYSMYVRGEVSMQRPHVLSMCAGSYEFVAERYAFRSVDATYAGRESDWIDFESRYSCDFAASINLWTADSPGGFCDNPPSSHTSTPHGTFSGHYESFFEGYELLRRARYNDFMTAGYVTANGLPLLRGVEKYKATSSYGQSVAAEGTISFNHDTEAAASYEPAGVSAIKSACSFFEKLFVDAIADDPIKTVTAASHGDEARWSDDAPDARASMLDGYQFAGARSLLGATIVHTLQLDRGASLNMDRETITGGYTLVNTPSFVGWA